MEKDTVCFWDMTFRRVSTMHLIRHRNAPGGTAYVYDHREIPKPTVRDKKRVLYPMLCIVHKGHIRPTELRCANQWQREYDEQA